MLSQVFLYFIPLLFFPASGNRISENVYQDLDATFSCFKITNATHEFGCRADFSGNVGVLAVANSTSALEELLKSEEKQSLVVVLQRPLFTVDTLQKLEEMTADSEKSDVKGVLLTLPDGSWQPDTVSFSEDAVCPNQMSSFYKPDKNPQQYNYCQNNNWNPAGSGMFRRHWTFPIILLKNGTQIADLYECHSRFNAGKTTWPRCSAEMQTFMAAAGNTEVCWRRTNSHYISTKASVYCSPMGSKNVFGTLQPLEETVPTVMLAARTDGFTMFDALAPAADSAAVGMVALLSVARALARLTPVKQPKANVMFMLFSGESFDYIGSDRLVWDMAGDKFPPRSVAQDEDGSPKRPPHLHLSDLQFYMELNQLALGQQLFLHSDPVSRSNASVDQKVSRLVSLMSNFSTQYSLPLAEAGSAIPLPPSSLHRLLKAKSDLPGLVVTDHEAAYTNRHYHSVYDTAEAVGFTGDAAALRQRLTQVTQVVASTLYALVAGKDSAAGQVPEVTVDQEWLRGALECYLERSNCSLFRGVMDEQMSDPGRRKFWARDVPTPYYVSVPGQATRFLYLMKLTRNLLAVETGEELPNSQGDCKADGDRTYLYRWLVRELENGTRQGFCSRSLVSSSEASSPAFEIDDYDWASGDHPSWAESQWVGFQLRIFLKPSLGHDVTHLVVGLLVTLLAVLLVGLLERRSHIVFSSPRYELQS